MQSYSLDDLRLKLEPLVSAVSEAERDLESAAGRLRDAQARLAGAEAFIGVLETDAPQERPKVSRKPANDAGPSAAVKAIMAEHPEGIHVHDIHRLAEEQGLGIDGEQVRSAVTYLSRRNDAERLSRGVWRLTIKNQDGPTEAGPSSESPSPVPAEMERVGP